MKGEPFSVHFMTVSGSVEDRHVNMFYPLVDIELADLLDKPEFRVLPRILKYAETYVEPEDIGRLIEEVDMVRTAFSQDEVVMADFDVLKGMLIESKERGTGICARGP